ncbi:nitroreductase [Staphylothermus marinus F1]|uniref:Nitroreductase n=1 Tax=Staphylothermus marinus (strain ATCC 43588 / DSM 3639 / JCM 9404 / F1) TaxID=399550 RepID=A3DKQ8_STAMF|nr:nitroreductase family protein [Staphylothermus marinus]ABN69218.1 nitroreductase [Staphylothermus marinus F1]
MSCNQEELINFLKTRRSIRKFKSEKIPDEILLKILDTARYSPSAHNSQPWKFVIIDDRQILDRLSKIHGGAKPLRFAPQAIVVLVNRKDDPDSYFLDGANATIYIQLAAHAFGIGSVWIQTMRNIDEIQEILNAPKDYVPVAILAIGYPDEKPVLRPRKPLEEIVCRNMFC